MTVIDDSMIEIEPVIEKIKTIKSLNKLCGDDIKKVLLNINPTQGLSTYSYCGSEKDIELFTLLEYYVQWRVLGIAPIVHGVKCDYEMRSPARIISHVKLTRRKNENIDKTSDIQPIELIVVNLAYELYKLSSNPKFSETRSKMLVFDSAACMQCSKSIYILNETCTSLIKKEQCPRYFKLDKVFEEFIESDLEDSDEPLKDLQIERFGAKIAQLNFNNTDLPKGHPLREAATSQHTKKKGIRISDLLLMMHMMKRRDTQ